MAAATAVAAVGVGISAYGAYSSNKRAKEAMAQASEQTAQQIAFQREQQKKLDAQKAKYRAFQFKNPYADVRNTYAGLQTDFENVYEDLTVDTQAAEFQMEQGAQQRANIMEGLRGAAGGSGIAALAQSLASQGTLQARQVSVDISRQQRANQMAQAQGAQDVLRREQMKAQGEGQAQMTRLGGEAMVQQAEMDRQATLLGIAQGESAGANQAVQAAYSNQMAASTAAAQMQAQNMSALSTSLGALSTAMPATPKLDSLSNQYLGTSF